MKSHIPVTAAPLPFTPPTLELAYEEAKAEANRLGHDVPDQPGVFAIKPLTEAEFDRLGYELFRHNLVPPTQDSFRAQMIEEIFTLFPEAEAEEKANQLDVYWQAEEAHQMLMADWQEAERQRLVDQGHGAPKRAPTPLPERALGVRDRNRALLLAEQVRSQSRKLRDMSVEMQTYDAHQRAGIARLVILGWTGFKTPFERVDDIVPEETYDALRSEIGKAAIRDLEIFCTKLGAVSQEERGNSELPPETEEAPPPSPSPNAALVNSGGASTYEAEETPSRSNSEPIPEDASPEMPGESSTSSSPSTGETSTTDDTLPAY